MSDRSWFFASQGRQEGPYPERQLRDLIAAGTVTADTLVWSEGMANWLRAGDIPGLVAAGAGPPATPRPVGALAGGGGHAGQPLSIDFGIWDFTWRSLLLLVGTLLVIPAPWVIAMYCRWIVSCLHVPGRPNLSFTGRAATIALWLFGAIVIALAVSQIDMQLFNSLELLAQFALEWLFIRWCVANIASDGQPIGLSFSGSIFAFVGWNILIVLSIFTIIGWAWVYVAQIRWFCRNIQGSRREVIFNSTGLEFLWRTIVALLASLFIIPIPWVYRWLMRWMASNTVLAERQTPASV
jgi:GYF domain 2